MRSAQNGDAYGQGMVFELGNPQRTSGDGAGPSGTVSLDTAGNVNGTTTFGGNLSDCHGTGFGVLLRDLALQPPWITAYNKDRLFLPRFESWKQADAEYLALELVGHPRDSEAVFPLIPNIAEVLQYRSYFVRSILSGTFSDYQGH